MQAGDNADIGSPKQLENLIRLVMAHDEEDRFVGFPAMFDIDLLRQPFRLLLQRAVSRELGARGRRGLNECELALP